METITIDGMDEHDFRHSIEDMLRHDDVDDAINRLRALLTPYAGEGGILPARFLTVTTDQIALSGWSGLGARLGAFDRPGHPISAIGIAMADPIEAGRRPDDAGRLAPCIETCYLSDSGYPFSEATRDDLLDGYSREGFEYQGDFEGIDTDLAIDGIDDLYGAIAQLETRLLRSDNPHPDEIRAGSLGACFLAALIHQAVRDTIRRQGLPRPLCVMTGCDGVYPFFDAPVTGSIEDTDVAKPAWQEEWGDEDEAEGPLELTPGEASLLNLISRKEKTKKPVLVVNREDMRKAERFNEAAAAHQMRGGHLATPDDHSIHEPAEWETASLHALPDALPSEPDEADSFDLHDEEGGEFASLVPELTEPELTGPELTGPELPGSDLPSPEFSSLEPAPELDFDPASESEHDAGHDENPAPLPEPAAMSDAVPPAPAAETVASSEPDRAEPDEAIAWPADDAEPAPTDELDMPEPDADEPAAEPEREIVEWPVSAAGPYLPDPDADLGFANLTTESRGPRKASAPLPDFTPGRHSLRSRLSDQQPQSSPAAPRPKRSLIAAILGWLKRRR